MKFSIVILVVLSCIAFATGQNNNATELRFLVVGDWGGADKYPYYTIVQSLCAKQMGITAESFQSQFTLAVGDNFYKHGIPTDVTDPRFQETFEQIYTADSLQTRWYMVAGNHDHDGNITAQLAYTQVSPRWYFPALWYTEVFTIPNSDVTVEIIIFDTWAYSNGSRQVQLDFVKTSLENSKADWVFVAGHYPMWSIGENGPTEDLLKDINPLLEEYKVAAYISGHDHDLQHIHLDNETTVDYYLSGAGHSISYNQDNLENVPFNSSKFYYPPDDDSDLYGGFITVAVGESSMTVNYWDLFGNFLYSHSKENPRVEFIKKVRTMKLKNQESPAKNMNINK